MAPAFSSTKQAGAFALLLLVLLLLPAMIGKSLLPPREEIYSALSWRIGAYPFLHEQIFEEKKDIDIAFIGSSHIWLGIDTPYVQKALSRKLGRPAVVVSLCWGWHGLDAFYLITRDLLQHRKVHMIVFDDDCGVNTPHCEAWRWFRMGDNFTDLAGLSLRHKLYYYYGAVIGMPQNLLELLRPNLPANSTPNKELAMERDKHEILSNKRLGSKAVQMGFDWRPDLYSPNNIPQSRAQPSDVCIYSNQSDPRFDFSGPPAPPLQACFAQKLVALATEHQTQIAILILPHLAAMRDAVIRDSPFWLAGMEDRGRPLGIPPAKLFSGLSDQAVLGLFADPVHLNQNGQEYYTPLITPSLIQLYDRQTSN